MDGVAYFAIVAVTVVLMVIAMAGAARRLLGVRFGLVRLVLAGSLALAVSGPLSRAIVGGAPSDSSGIAPLWFFLPGRCWTPCSNRSC